MRVHHYLRGMDSSIPLAQGWFAHYGTKPTERYSVVYTFDHVWEGLHLLALCQQEQILTHVYMKPGNSFIYYDWPQWESSAWSVLTLRKPYSAFVSFSGMFCCSCTFWQCIKIFFIPYCQFEARIIVLTFLVWCWELMPRTSNSCSVGILPSLQVLRFDGSWDVQWIIAVSGPLEVLIKQKQSSLR